MGWLLSLDAMQHLKFASDFRYFCRKRDKNEVSKWVEGVWIGEYETLRFWDVNIAVVHEIFI